ncbi:hypothetical protein [Ruegeria hyattellae]|uniref:hypothetical protein n=1 Tax=Ruegeria hyattellae TaxID=3233337 RepID=UPI00355BB810
MTRLFKSVLASFALALISACAHQPIVVDRGDVAMLAQEIQSLGPEVDPEEAQRAASIAYVYSAQLAQEYDITDPPLVHNAKVNSGIKERGLCYQWAEDIEARLKQENFQTLTIHRAIAEPRNAFVVDHSTALISKRGDSLKDGIVLDPWRDAGDLHWALTREDTRYDWQPRLQVLEDRRRRRDAKR